MTYDDLENKRKKYRNRIFLSLIITAIIFYFIAINASIIYESIIEFSIAGIILGFVIFILLTSKPKKEYSKAKRFIF